MRASTVPLACVFLLVLASCGDDAPGGSTTAPIDDSRPECENVNPLNCLLPFPSSRYLVDAAATATGRRIEMPVEAMPRNIEGTPVDPVEFGRFDGFSPMTSMVTVFEGELDTTDLAGEDRIADSLLADSATVVIDAATGERVAHFAEIDAWTRTDRELAPFYIRPAARLAEDRRYVVAIRNLSRVDGTPVEPSPYFRALRDGESTQSDGLEARRAAFEDIFAVLDGAGVDRATLIEAWDFHTGSGESIWRDPVHMRDDALAQVGDRGLGCTVTEVETDISPDVWRRVHGTFTVPLYMTAPGAGQRLNRGSDGLPEANGTDEVPFQLQIPPSVRDRVEGGGTPVALMTYGHGQFGSRSEVGTGWLQEYLNTYEMVASATDWVGMSEEDILVIGDIATEFSRFPEMTERVLQAMVNFMVMTRSIGGVCSDLPELQTDAGQPVVDPNANGYLGISQGGILGATLAALSTDIERFILQVGAISYPIMMKRSVNFGPFAVIIDTWYGDFIDGDLMVVASGAIWDLAEPATFAPHILSNPLPGAPPKRVLYQTGWYDAQVPNAASDIAARTMGLPRMTPSVRDVWGLEAVSGSAESAYVEYRIPDVEAWEPGTRSPPGDNAAHEGVRRTPAAQRQMDTFLRDGMVIDMCEGPCDPE